MPRLLEPALEVASRFGWTCQQHPDVMGDALGASKGPARGMAPLPFVSSSANTLSIGRVGSGWAAESLASGEAGDGRGAIQYVDSTSTAETC